MKRGCYSNLLLLKFRHLSRRNVFYAEAPMVRMNIISPRKYNFDTKSHKRSELLNCFNKNNFEAASFQFFPTRAKLFSFFLLQRKLSISNNLLVACSSHVAFQTKNYKNLFWAENLWEHKNQISFGLKFIFLSFFLSFFLLQWLLWQKSK